MVPPVSKIRLLLAAALLSSGLSGCALPARLTLPGAKGQEQPAAVQAQASATVRPSATVPAGPTATAAPPQVSDALWVANEVDGNLLVIDPADNSTAVILPTNLHPRWVTEGEGYVWALDAENDLLIQVDPRDYGIVRVIPFPKRDVNALTTGAGAVWVALTEKAEQLYLLPDEEYLPAGGVARVNAESGEIESYTQVGPVVALAFQPGALWALTRGLVDTPLVRIDPLTLTVQPLPLNDSWALDDAFSLTPDSLWFFSTAFGKLYRAAPDGALYAEIALGQHSPIGPALLLPAGGDIWLAAPWGVLLRYDAGQQRISAEIPLEHPAGSLAYAGGAVWAVSPLGGVIYRIDPARATIVATLPLGAQAQPTPVLSPTPILRATIPCEGAPYSRLALGMRAATPSQPPLPNRVRKDPGQGSEVSGYILAGQSVQIIDGPQCMDDWVWWKIHNEINQVEGWAAEGSEDEYWLIPLP